MLKNLILPFCIYRLKVKLHSLEARVKKMETTDYLDLQGRKNLSEMRKMLSLLHEKETALYFSLSI